MQRRSFLKAGGAVTLAAGFGADSLLAHVSTHNFDRTDFRSGSPVADRLYQGPFSADDYPSWNVVMALTPSLEVAPNYGIGVPGVLRASVTSENGKVNVGGSLDAGYALPGKVRQARFALPKGTNWKGLRLRAEIEVKGQRYPVRWACGQKLNEDGSLTLRPTAGLGQDDETGGVPPTVE
jgi:hypothetical protein